LTPTKRWKTEAGAAAMAYRRRTRRGCGRDAEVASFYSCALRGGNAGLRKEGEREVTARHGDRATGVHARGEMGQLGATQRRSMHVGCKP
jgi:hypothetical protein